MQRLKRDGIWSAPVASRPTDETSVVHVKLSTLLDLHGWQLKERYFDPHFRAGRRQVDVRIDCDFTEPLLPIIAPQDYGQSTSAVTPLFWFESTDESKLKLQVEEKNGRYFLGNVSGYNPPDRHVFYFVDWDFIGDQKEPKALKNVEVEPNRLYLVHLYELSKPRPLADFWTGDDSRKACDAALLWVGGQGVRQTVCPAPDTTGVLREIREDPAQAVHGKPQWLEATRRSCTQLTTDAPAVRV